MEGSPLFISPVRTSGAAESPRALRGHLRRIGRRIARLGLVATAVASLAGIGGVGAAPPFDDKGCNNGQAACLATGGVLYPYLADPSVYGAGGYAGGIPVSGVQFVNGVPVGVPYGGYGGYGGYGPGFAYNGLPSGQCYFSPRECNEPQGSVYQGYNVYPPPTAAPFAAYPSTALVTPPPAPVPAPFAVPGAPVATLPPPAPPGIPAPPQGFGPQGVPQQGFGPQGVPPQGFAPSAPPVVAPAAGVAPATTTTTGTAAQSPVVVVVPNNGVGATSGR